MVPDNEPVSAFAAYTKGNNSESRSSRRRKMKKLKKKAAASVDKPSNVASPKMKKAKKIAGKLKKVAKAKDLLLVTSTGGKPEEDSPVGTSPEASSSLVAQSKKNNHKKMKFSQGNDEVSLKSILTKGKQIDKSNSARSFSLLNDSLDLASTSTFRMMPSSTPAKPELSISDLSDEEGEDIRDSLNNYTADMEESKNVSTKRKKRQVGRIQQVKKRALDAEGSEVLGKSALQRLLAPMDVDVFMRDYWEKRVLHVPATNPRKFARLLSTELMDKVLRNEILCFGRDLDVTTYSDGERQNHNVEGSRAQAHVVWDFYANGCSIRLLHPHTHSKPLMIVMSALQEYFGCLVGANSYLTPPSSQGFAPHYDDIEAFIVQLEGRKRWRVYKPRTKNEVLPRFSSPNFAETDLTEPPVFDGILSPGDLLYFPRGYIHQAHTLHNEHSLHVTVSVYQKTAWCDLMEKLVSNALKTAVAKEIDFRRGLPVGYLRHAGVFTKHSAADRKALIHNAKGLISKLANHIDIDSAVDELGVQFMHDALPPILTPAEAVCSVIGNGWRMDPNGKLKNKIEFPSNTRVRLTRANCYRLVQEEVVGPDGESFTQVSLYYTVDNSKLFHGEEPNFLVVDSDLLITLKALVHAYPQFTTISDLPYDTEDKMYGLICDLWDHGLLVTETPPEPVDDHASTVLGDNEASSETDSVDGEETSDSTNGSQIKVDGAALGSSDSSEDEDFIVNEVDSDEEYDEDMEVTDDLENGSEASEKSVDDEE